ncbi:MAG TPA: amino acid permease [Solirubrobacteraceae bacterium]
MAHPRTLGWFGTSALAMGGSNQSLFLIGALFVSQGTGAVPLLIIGLLLSWAATPGWIELVLMWPERVGGIAATCAEAFRPYSPVLANLTGVCYWWGWIPTCGLTALLSAAALHHWYLPFLPVPLLASAIVVAFTGVNLCGVKWVTRLAVPIACASAGLAFLSAVVPALAGTVDWHKAASFDLKTPFAGVFGGVTSAMAGIYLIGFAAPAFEAAACHVGEMKDPIRNLPRAMFASAGIASLYFIALPVIWLGALGAHPIEGELMRTLGPTFAPLLGGAAKAAAIWFMVLNMFHGTLQPLAGASRTLSQLSEDGLLPRVLARRSRYDVPWVATVLTAGVAIAFLLRGNPVWVIAAANFCYLIAIGMPSVAVWLLRRHEPDMERPYRAPRGWVTLGLLAAGVWGLSTVLGFQQFGLPTVLAGLALAYAGSFFYAYRTWSDRRRAGIPGVKRSLHLKLTGAMVAVMVLDGSGYLLAVSHVDSQESLLLTVLSDIFVAVALLTITVGLVLPGMISHATEQVTTAAGRLAKGTVADLTKAMEALAAGRLEAAHARVDVEPVRVRTRDEVHAMAESFNTMQIEVSHAAVALDGAREGLRAVNATLERNVAQQAAVARLGQRAIEGRDLQELMEILVETVGSVLDVDRVAVLELDADGEALRIMAALGPYPSSGRHVRVPMPADPRSRAALLQSEPLIIEDWAQETWLELPKFVHDPGTTSSVSMPIHGGATPFGVLSIQSASRRSFARDELDFLHAIANLLAQATERSRSEADIRHQALHDPLTGLPNRTLFVDRLGVALAQARRRESWVAVLFLDVDNFKLVNDSLGHGAGDELLLKLSARLDESLRAGDTMARFGGDEFVVICSDVGGADEAIAIAERTRAVLQPPFVVRAVEHRVTASIGIALSRAADRDAEDLVREADAAMYRAKERGRGGYEIYDEAMRDRATARLRTENQLAHAIEYEELRLAYQPIVAMDTGETVGVEALVRWQHPERGVVAPMDFIPIAEDTGLIVPIGEWVLTEAWRQAAEWRRARPDAPPLWMSVNLSARQIAHPNLVTVVADVLRETGMDPGQLRLELTESSLMEDPEAALATMNALTDLGVKLVLDDFGTGYSSLAYVQRFPIAVLKVDRSFVSNLGGDSPDGAIVAAVISMAHGLGVEVVAEGVETEGQAAALQALGCEYAQGYLYGRPMPAEELRPRLAATG